MANNIVTNAPNLAGQPQVKLVKNDFDALVWDKGYEVYHEHALRCPCKEQGADNLSSCRNCGGSGWFFINKTETRMVLQSMNQETQFKEWSEEHRGTTRITAMNADRLAFMDKITLREAESVSNETIYPTLYEETTLFAYTVYDIVSVKEVFLFEGNNQKLKKLEEDTDFTFEADKGKIILDSQYNTLENPKLSIRYVHRPQFFVVDVTRNVMNSDVFDKTQMSGKKNEMFPVSAIGRLLHYTLAPKNYDGGYLFDNSYNLPRSSCPKP